MSKPSEVFMSSFVCSLVTKAFFLLANRKHLFLHLLRRKTGEKVYSTSEGIFPSFLTFFFFFPFLIAFFFSLFEAVAIDEATVNSLNIELDKALLRFDNAHLFLLFAFLVIFFFSSFQW